MMKAAHTQQREFDFSHKDFEFISKLVRQKTGIVLAEHKENMVYSRIARRLRALGLKRFSDYCDLLMTEKGEAEIVDFVNAVTTNLTHFFREPHHFEHFQNEVVPFMEQQLASHKRDHFRIWSAGCSSGMEPYSIALSLLKSGSKNLLQKTKILATDIDTNMIRRGQNANYAIDSIKNIPANMQKQYCTIDKSSGTFQLSSEARKYIKFNYLNLLEEWPMRVEFDVIFCRNVVIYFNKDTQRTLFDRMADQMPMGGWLYIGHSENLSSVTSRFELIGRTIYRRVE